MAKAHGKRKAADTDNTQNDSNNDGSIAQLEASLRNHNASFSHLLELIPPQFYLHAQDEDEDGNDAQRDGQNKKQKRLSKAEKVKQAAETEKAKKLARQQAKKAKFDPNTPRTVLEIQAAREKKRLQRENGLDSDDESDGDVTMTLANGFGATSTSTSRLDAQTSNKQNGAAKATAQLEAQDDEDDEEEDSPNETDFEGSDDEGNTTTSKGALPSTSASTLPSALSAGSPEGSEMSSMRDAILDERRKKAETAAKLREARRSKTRARIAQERLGNTSGISSKKKDIKNDGADTSLLAPSGQGDKKSHMSDVKKAFKKAGKKTPVSREADDEFGGDLQGSSAMQVAKKPALPVAPQPSTSTNAVSAPSSSKSAAASISFSSLDFTPTSSIQSSDPSKLSKKQRLSLANSTRTGILSKDPSIALNAINKRNEFLEKLTPQAKERAMEKDKWEKMELKAGGTKVYDEESKLKKMVKKKEKAKEKSRKDWADRKETVTNNQAAQQKKRNENIAARLQQKKDKKMGVKKPKSVGKANPKKKGRPGFEGKGGGSSSGKKR